MNLVGLKVNHKTYGKGTVVLAEEKNITVEFEEKTAKFLIPTICESFIRFEDDSIQNAMIKQIEEEALKKQEAERIRKEQEEARKAAINESDKSHKKMLKRKNVAFKCNYCDGSKTDFDIGFHGVCSDKTNKYNIEEARYTWCSNDECPCKQYLNGDISRDELDSMRKDNFICYESKMLDEWKAYAGERINGENKGIANKLLHVQNQSLAVLTTRFPETSEEERVVFGVFLVDDSYEGDNRSAGYVTTNSKYKIALSESEARQIKFWNYYFNPNSTEKAHWGTGLHRYIDDIQAAQILKDIVVVKNDNKDKLFAEEFLNYFCKINNVNVDNLPKPNGVLLKNSDI